MPIEVGDKFRVVNNIPDWARGLILTAAKVDSGGYVKAYKEQPGLQKEFGWFNLSDVQRVGFLGVFDYKSPNYVVSPDKFTVPDKPSVDPLHVFEAVGSTANTVFTADNKTFYRSDVQKYVEKEKPVALLKKGDKVRHRSVFKGRFFIVDEDQNSLNAQIKVRDGSSNFYFPPENLELVSPVGLENTMPKFEPGDVVTHNHKYFVGKGTVTEIRPNGDVAVETAKTSTSVASAVNLSLVRKGEKVMDKFYVVWNPASSYPITQRYTTRDQAQKVAESMATKHKSEFFVLEAVGLAEVVKVSYKEIK